MEKEFVPNTEALALQELGFDEPCLRNNTTFHYDNNEFIFSKGGILYQQAFRWFREKHRLQAEILWRGDMDCFCYKTGRFKQGSHDFSKEDYSTYEEAELKCLKKLIELCKKV